MASPLPPHTRLKPSAHLSVGSSFISILLDVYPLYNRKLLNGIHLRLLGNAEILVAHLPGPGEAIWHCHSHTTKGRQWALASTLCLVLHLLSPKK